MPKDHNQFAEDLLLLFWKIHELDRVPRAGFLLRGVPDPESVAAHSHFLATLALLFVRENPGDYDQGKVLAMAPPITRISTFSTRLPRRSSLVDTLEPPTIAATGREGRSSTAASASSSACIRRPAAQGRRCAIASVEACARCAVENASLT